MAKFCLPFSQAEKLIEKFKSGEITPEKLTDLDSAGRRKLFGELFDETTARQVNTLFESKLLLKNQQQGIIKWAEQLTGITPQVRNDLLERASKMEEVLTPENEAQFLEDLASKRIGVDITMEEAGEIARLAKEAQEAKTAMDNGADRMDYGRKRVEFFNYVNDLKTEGQKTAIDYVKDAPGIFKSVKATLDNSALFRQGWKTLWTNPGVWAKNAAESFKDIAKVLGGDKRVLDEINAEIVSRPTYDMMRKAKLAVGTLEEAFPSSLPEKIPVIGRAFKASEQAYTGFLYRQRADIFDKYLQIARETGVDLTEKELQSIGKLVNSLTGRGNLGALEPIANTVNNVFFSPRFLKSQIDTLGGQIATGAGGSNFVRKQAAINLAKILSGTAAVLATAKAINPDSVEADPRSSDFGKIKVGNTRFDVSGGMASLATLAMRLARQSTKSNGVVKELNSDEFGSQTGTDVVYNFFEGKLSPVGAMIKNLIEQETFEGDKPTVLGELKNLTVPLPIVNYQKLKDDPNSANDLLAIIADGLGIGTNTYSNTSADWLKSTGAELTQFKEKVGEQKFKEANAKYNDKVDQEISALKKSDKFKNATEEEKADLLTKTKADVKDKVFKEYGFKYKQKKK